MAISVIEAMQAGLVPIVTPVGEITGYCSDGVNSVFFEKIDDCVARIGSIIDGKECYSAMSTNAVDTWFSSIDYNMDLREKYTALF